MNEPLPVPQCCDACAWAGVETSNVNPNAKLPPITAGWIRLVGPFAGAPQAIQTQTQNQRDANGRPVVVNPPIKDLCPTCAAKYTLAALLALFAGPKTAPATDAPKTA